MARKFDPTTEPTQEELMSLWNTCTNWVSRARPSCVESIYQVDSVQEKLPDLAERVCTVVGYREND